MARTKKTHSPILGASHRNCGPGHWYRRDHAELLFGELQKAKKRGKAACFTLIRALEEDLKRETGHPKPAEDDSRRARPSRKTRAQ